jgi:hypothetical protein
MTSPRTDPSVQAFQHNARLNSNAAASVVKAAAGATQGGATAIGDEEIVIVTATASSQGIRLPAFITAMKRTIVAMSNRGVKVYPASGERIQGAATNAAVTVPLNRVWTFIADQTGLWRVIRGAAS